MSQKKKAVLGIALASAFVALGLVGIGLAEQSGMFDQLEHGLDSLGSDSRRGCDPEAGSSVAYPATGSMRLTDKQEQEGRSSARLASLSAGSGMGVVGLSNEDDEPAAVTLHDEDGMPRARAFVRGGEMAKLDVPAGSYDVQVESGRDWRGDQFGACSRQAKAKGIAVVGPNQSSHVLMYSSWAFVLANRMDGNMAARVFDDQEKRSRAKKEQGATVREAMSRPGREDRPGYSATAPKTD